MSQAQKQSYDTMIKSGKDKTQNQIILDLLNGTFAMNREQIAKWTGIKESSVTRGCSDLSKEGKLIEIPLNGVTYYSFVYVDKLRNLIKKRKAEERTKRVLKALVNDADAMDVLIKHTFIDAYCSYIRGREDDEIKEDIIEIIKNHIK